MIKFSSSIIIFTIVFLNFVLNRVDSFPNEKLSIRSRIREKISKKLNQRENEKEIFHDEPENEISQLKINTSVVVLTAISGIYLWWPTMFGGDDSFHLLLDQEEVPRFHDVATDQNGNIYLTAPQERSIYQLHYENGWWSSNFSNRSITNAVRSETPLFINIHSVSSRIYVYGHSDIQLIDLIEKPHVRGSAPFMKRLRELSPMLKISDLIIDQLTSEGYVVGDSYGWCTVIRCSLTVNQCEFLFKIPSSYDDRPYPCTGTIDFLNKIIYLSLEEKILGIDLNEQNNFGRRFILTEKRGSRSTLGYNDIVAYRNVIFYTDALRPLLHICTSSTTNSCSNISLSFPSVQQTILPLRLSVINIVDLHLPTVNEQENLNDSLSESNQTTKIPFPLSIIGSNRSQLNPIKIKPNEDFHQVHWNFSGFIMLMIGFFSGLLVSGLVVMIYFIVVQKSRFRPKSNLSAKERLAETMKNISDEEENDKTKLREEFFKSSRVDDEESDEEASSRSTDLTNSSVYKSDVTL